MWEWLTKIIEGIGQSGVGQAAASAAAQVPWTDVLGLGIQGLGAADKMGAFGEGGLFGADQMPMFGNGQMSMFGGGQMPGIQAQTAAGANPAGVRRTLSDAQSQGLSGASPDFLATLAGVTPEELTQLLGLQGGGQG